MVYVVGAEVGESSSLGISPLEYWDILESRILFILTCIDGEVGISVGNSVGNSVGTCVGKSDGTSVSKLRDVNTYSSATGAKVGGFWL